MLDIEIKVVVIILIFLYFIPIAYHCIINVGVLIYFPFIFKFGKRMIIEVGDNMKKEDEIVNTLKNKNFDFIKFYPNILYVRTKFSIFRSLTLFTIRFIIDIDKKNIQLYYNNLVKYYLYFIIMFITIAIANVNLNKVHSYLFIIMITILYIFCIIFYEKKELNKYKNKIISIIKVASS